MVTVHFPEYTYIVKQKLKFLFFFFQIYAIFKKC